MPDFTTEQIERELELSETPAEVRHEFELQRVRAACREHDIRFSEHWLSPTGRIGLAQVIAAKVSGRDAAGLERDWLVMLRSEDNG